MKKHRQKTILDLVRTQQIASQEELLEGLRRRNIEVSRFTADITLARRFFNLESPADPLFGLTTVVHSAIERSLANAL